MDNVLIGLILDISGSMKSNTINKDGESVPCIEVLQRAVNNHFTKVALKNKIAKEKNKQVYIFCLGLGVHGYVKEDRNFYIPFIMDKSHYRYEEDLIVDLLYVKNKIPDEDYLEELKKEINSRWNTYISKSIVEWRLQGKNPYDELHIYLSNNLKKSAVSKLSKNRIHKRIFILKLFNKLFRSNYIQNSIEACYDKIEILKNKINSDPEKVSIQFKNNLESIAYSVFEERKGIYKKFIEKKIKNFASNTSKRIIQSHFNEKKFSELIEEFKIGEANNLTTKLYKYLQSDLQKRTFFSWRKLIYKVKRLNKEIDSEIDFLFLKKLAEECIKYTGYEVLEPTINSILYDIFKKDFEREIIYHVPYLFGESTEYRSIGKIEIVKNLIPNFVIDPILKKFMFRNGNYLFETIKEAYFRFKESPSENKMLILFSDGGCKRKNNKIIEYANNLKELGVVIISCYLFKSNIMNGIVVRPRKYWDDGSILMCEIASEVKDSPMIYDKIKENDLVMPDETKLFYQVNHSDIMEKIIEAVTI